MTTITVTLQDSKVTAIVADSVVGKLQQYIIDYRIKKQKKTVLIWKNSIRNANRNIIKLKANMPTILIPTAISHFKAYVPNRNVYRMI